MSQVRAEFSPINKKETIKQGSYKKQRYYKTVPRTVFPKFFALVVRRIWNYGVPKKRKLFGEKEKEIECLNEFQRNSFKHGITFDASQVRALHLIT